MMDDFKGHTPGPWKAHNYHSAGEHWTVCTTNAFYAGSNNDIFQKHDHGVTTSEANAKLVAAAPEMLDALLHITEIYAIWEAEGCMDEESSNLNDVALAALRKAEVDQ